ncbi:MAG: glycosyltransferase family 39 protein [Chloroflexi bacterium]|nr:glycosyltransferase family 39 protein [Chloroflexota bacterium]MBI3340405.1 glycosyltransferase family 39 protein [Chloroflexota bacterium]
MKNEKHPWLYDLLLILVLLVGIYFRTIGLNWDADQHLHPDERFLTMVESALQVKKCELPNTPLESCPPEQVRWLGLGDYFNTASSPLNPQNRGFGFFVYGDLPIVLTRYVAEWVGRTGYDQVNMVGRQISLIGDLFSVLLIYIIAARLYNRRVALLGAAFSALAVLQIQQSHFFTVDTIANFFIFLAIYFAVEIVISRKSGIGNLESIDTQNSALSAKLRITNYALLLIKDPLFLFSLGFGISLGLAVASKLNAVPLAILLPGAFALRALTVDHRPQAGENGQPSIVNGLLNTGYWSLVTIYLIVGALASILIFRIFMPYAFSGIGLNPAWIANIKELAGQSSGDIDVPFALQWARRSRLFSFTNLTVWGLGLPLGILAWTGFLAMAWRILKGERKHILLWGWTALYFGWQSLAFNPTMRYQLPIYPLLAMMAGWLVIYLWDEGKKRKGQKWSLLFALSSVLIGATVLALTLGWAYAFTRIYTRPVTRLAATRWIYQNVPGPINLRIKTADGTIYQQPLTFPAGGSIQNTAPYILSFTANASGTLTDVFFPHVTAVGAAAPQTLSASLSLQPNAPPDQTLATSTLTSDFAFASDTRGRDYALSLDRPLVLNKGQTYFLSLTTTGALTLVGAAPINETDWDDGLPLRLGAEAYDGFGGLYQGGLNLQIYWDDNADKLTRFVNTLSQGDYIFMSSNRQWASVTRIPERYPLTTAYYRALIGCPAEKDVIWCYNVAKPGQFEGQLGYKLVAVFESYPTLEIPGLFKWQANDQFAEEAFTVYDHPKVLIFQKTPDFNAAQVQTILGAVDLSNVVRLTPKQAGSYKNLMLTPDRAAQEQAGGTWSQLFSYDWIQNKYPFVGLVVWYLFIFLLGLLIYPLVRIAFPGLGDKGYPLARALGLVIFGYLSWLSGSVGVPVTRATVGVVFAVLAAAGLGLGWMRRAELRAEWKSRRNYFLMVEGVFLAFFVFDLLIRIGNPDLWHPSKGGERPMDFSYFNAVLKSTSFPPYDPWFAGGYINYYYYGFVLVATPVKLLGIVPTIAYNFILPTLFATTALCAFSIGWNLLDGNRESGPGSWDDSRSPILDSRFVAGLLAALLMVALGNLGTLRMLYQGFERMAAPGGIIDNANIVQRAIWAAEGLGKSLTGQPLPFGRGDWYWNPSRVIPPGPGNEITEFPFFTFLYSDLHANMLAMPLALLALAWALSVIKGRRVVSWLSLSIGALIIGALYPTNLSDIYTYLPIGFIALAYSLWRYADAARKWFGCIPVVVKKLALIVGSIVLLTALSFVLYEPYRVSYFQSYSALDSWTASQTPIWSYLTHWGVFLFIIVAWMTWETHEWMASTPVSSLNKLRPYQPLIEANVAIVLAALLYFAYRGMEIGWVALPVAAWAGVLMLRPNMPDVKRFVLFLIGTSMLITIVVELVVVRGDIGRMNTVFKFYLQAWALLSISAAAAFAWLLPDVRKWLPGWRNFFQAGATFVLAGAALTTISSAVDKVSDRMAGGVPFTLDSITYMQYAQYADFGATMDLSQDYRAIRWMQDNVKGSPVIVEANTTEYKWGTRYTIYTGLPGVVGWSWHQRQQRTLTPQLVTGRIDEIASFYTTQDAQAARGFLKKYNVKYVIVGQLERLEYPGLGLAKFEQFNGQFWSSVYRDGDTVIYQVNP